MINKNVATFGLWSTALIGTAWVIWAGFYQNSFLIWGTSVIVTTAVFTIQMSAYKREFGDV